MMQDKPAIPPHSSKASQIRAKVAFKLVQHCPFELGKECILTGSSSRGLSDDASDLEQVFYVDTLPTMNQRENWLEEDSLPAIPISSPHASSPMQPNSGFSHLSWRHVLRSSVETRYWVCTSGWCAMYTMCCASSSLSIDNGSLTGSGRERRRANSPSNLIV